MTVNRMNARDTSIHQSGANKVPISVSTRQVDKVIAWIYVMWCCGKEGNFEVFLSTPKLVHFLSYTSTLLKDPQKGHSIYTLVPKGEVPIPPSLYFR